MRPVLWDVTSLDIYCCKNLLLLLDFLKEAKTINSVNKSTDETKFNIHTSF